MEEREDYQQTPIEELRLSHLLSAALPLYKLQEYDYLPWEEPERNEYAEVIMQAFLEILPHINSTNIRNGFSATCNCQVWAYLCALEALKKVHDNPGEYEKLQQIEDAELAEEREEMEKEAEEMRKEMEMEAALRRAEAEEAEELYDEALRRAKDAYRAAFFGYLDQAHHDK